MLLRRWNEFPGDRATLIRLQFLNSNESVVIEQGVRRERPRTTSFSLPVNDVHVPDYGFGNMRIQLFVLDFLPG